MYVKFFSDISKKDVRIAGGKGASLGEMSRAGFPVPEGFVVLSSAFEEFMYRTGISKEINSIFENIRVEESSSVEQASQKIQSIIKRKKLPLKIEEKINKSFSKLKCEYVAVRSSATAEDGANAAWAGQLESYLNSSKKNLIENVRNCWASLFTPRAIVYRFEKGMEKNKISVAVVVQKMVESEVSGIAFSVHPVTQNSDEIIIEAGRGLGEAVVSGQITPDSYTISKKEMRILDRSVNNQERQIVRGANGKNEWVITLSGEGQKLPDDKIVELTKIIIKIEKHYGFPCDIEWALEKNKLYIVQSRPITTLGKPGAELKKKDGLIVTKRITKNRKPKNKKR